MRKLFAVAVALVAAVVPIRESGASPTLISTTPDMTVVDAVVADGGMVLARLEPRMLVFAPVGSFASRHYDRSRPGHLGLIGDVTPNGAAEIDPIVRQQQESAAWTDEAVDAMFAAVDRGEPLSEAVKVGMTQRAAAGPLVEEGTLRLCQDTGDDKQLRVKGCSFYADGTETLTERYLGDSSYAWGRTSSYLLEQVYTVHSWKNHKAIVRSSPEQTYNPGGCIPGWSVSVAGYGVSIGYTATVCPEKIDPVEGPEGEAVMMTSWYGEVKEAQRYTEQATLSLIPVPASPSGFKQEIGGYIWFSDACGFACHILENLPL